MSETILEILGTDHRLRDSEELTYTIYSYKGEDFESEDAAMIFQLFYLTLDKTGVEMPIDTPETFARVLRWYFGYNPQ